MRNTLAKLAKTHGAENMRFFFPASPLHVFGPIAFTTSEDETVIVEARAKERFNRIVSEGYKVELHPIDKQFAYRDFYQSDFEGLAEDYPDEYFVMIGNQKVTFD